MSTELNQVVHSMSQISIPQDILNKVDMKNLLKGFSDDYKKLDDLKAARSRHEDRNFIGRWWNNNELEDAQLDAAELQASFSKKLGQLMVISVAQSQQLHQQQNGLSEQQNTIKRQTDQLAKNDEHLKEQQLSLEEQNKKLEKLVNEYFELKGLTQDGALKLVKIANEVKVTKDSLLMNFDDRMKEIECTRKEILEAQAKLVDRQTQQLSIFKAESEHRLDSQTQQIEQRIKQALTQITQTEEKLYQALTMNEQRIADNQAKALEQQKQQQAEYDQRWQADRMQVLERLIQHQQRWEQEAQKQNTRLDVLHTDNNRLQQQLGELAEQHQQQIEILHQLLNDQNKAAELRDLNWSQRWKTMTRTVAVVLSLLTIALGYLAYTSYYHLPLF